MKKEEQLLRALGNVKDSFVLEASRYMDDPQSGVMVRPKKKKRPGWMAAAAAVLVVTFSLGLLSLRAGQITPETDRTALVRVEENGSWPTFQLEYDPQTLAMTQGDGGVFLSPQAVTNRSVCEIQIEFLPGLLPYAAMEQTRKAVTGGEVTSQLDQETGIYSLHIAYGSAWDALVEDVTIVGAGCSGSYRLTARYILEDAENWGVTFAQVCASFTCPLSESVNPEAEAVIADFAEGYFSGNQLTMLGNYYGDSQDLKDTYPQDASRVRLVSLRGLDTLDEQIAEKGSGVVSLTFLETELEDSYTYLTMDVMHTQAGYRITFYGLEK